MQNIDDRLILTAEVAKHEMAKRTEIYFYKFGRYFGLHNKPSSGADRGLTGGRTGAERGPFSSRGRFVLQTEISGRFVK